MKTFIKRLFTTLLLLVLLIVVAVGGYCGYILLSYKRIGNTNLDVKQSATNSFVTTNEVYNISTYNIGFGAYSQDFTFFLDTGYDANENETCGYYSKAKSKDAA